MYWTVMSGRPQQLFNGWVRLDRVNDKEERERGSTLFRTGVFKESNGGKINYIKE